MAFMLLLTGFISCHEAVKAGFDIPKLLQM